MQESTRADPRKRVLVVEDDPTSRVPAEIELERADYEIISAPGGDECIEVAAREIPDVIVLDPAAEGVDQSEVLTELSRNPATQDIPVVFLSARDSTEERVRGLGQGAVDWILMSTDPREIAARIGAAARTKARVDHIRMEIGEDPVTGLMGRPEFERRLDKEISRSSRNSAPFAILLMDLDGAPGVTERHGPETRDALLREVTAVLRTNLRASDESFRYADEKLAAVLPDTELSTAYLAAERCREHIRAIEVAGRPTSLSIGIAQFTTGRAAEELIGKAETALLRAKESGGDRSWRADDPRRHALSATSLAEELTDREWDVLIHLSHRRTEQDIASRLGITRGTVRSHKARIRRKLHVSPDVRLSEFVRANFKGLTHRLPDNDGS